MILRKDRFALFVVLSLAAVGGCKRDSAQVPATQPAPPAENAVTEAAALLQSGDAAAAVATLGPAIQAHPDDPEAYRLRAEAYQRLSNLRAAVADFQKVIDLRPASAEPCLQRAVALVAAGRLPQAQADVDEAFRREPNNPAAFAMRAAIRIERGEYDAAIRDCDEALRLKPQFATALNNRALAEFRKGEDASAIADCTAAIALNTMNSDALNTRGSAYQRAGRIEDAARDFDEAVRISPGAFLPRWNRARLALNHGDPATAVKHFSVLITQRAHAASAPQAQDPALTRLLLLRASAYQQQGDLQSAMKDATAAIANQPANPDGYLARRDIARALGDNAQADSDQLRADVLRRMAR